MSNRNKKMKKNYMLTGKKAGFLAVAAMSAVLVGTGRTRSSGKRGRRN